MWTDIDQEFPKTGKTIITSRDLGDEKIFEVDVVDNQFLKYYKLNNITHWKENDIDKMFLCTECGDEHNNDEWNSFCSKNCFFGLPKYRK